MYWRCAWRWSLGAEGVLEALPIGLTGGPRLPQPPLADEGRAIPRVAKHLRDRHVLGLQRRVAGGQCPVSPDGRVAGVQPGHEHGPRRRTHGAARIVLREPHAFARQAIERGRLKPRLAVRAQVAVAQVVGLDQQDVRRPRRLRALGSGAAQEHRQEQDAGYQRSLHISSGTTLVASAFRRKDAAGARLPPEGGSHTLSFQTQPRVVSQFRPARRTPPTRRRECPGGSESPSPDTP